MKELAPLLKRSVFDGLTSFGYLVADPELNLELLERLFASPLFPRLRAFGVALDGDGEEPEWLTEHAERWKDKTLFSGSCPVFEFANWDAPRDQLAIVLHDVDRDAEALALREDLVLVDPEDAYFWDNLGDSRRACELSAEALEAYGRALKLDPEQENAWAGKADILDDLDRNKEALEAWERALSFSPRDAHNQHGRAMSLEKLGRHDEALVAYAKAWREDKTLFHAPSNRGDLNLKLGRLDDAFADYKASLASDDDGIRFNGLLNSAIISKVRGQHARASDYIDKARPLATTAEETSFLDAMKAELALAEGRTADARGIYDRLAASAEPDDDVHYSRAMLLLELGLVDAAEAAFAKFPEGVAVLSRAFLLEAGGKPEEALAALEEPANDELICPNNDLCKLLLRGLLLRRLGREKAAVRLFRQAHPAPVDHVLLHKKLSRVPPPVAGAKAREVCGSEGCFPSGAAAAVLACLIDGKGDEAAKRAAAFGRALETRDPSEYDGRCFAVRRLAKLAGVESRLLTRTFAVAEALALPRTLYSGK